MADNTPSTSQATFQVQDFTVSFWDNVGFGSFGTVVRRGWDAQGRPVAVKEIQGQRYARVKEQDFQRMLQLDHPNLVQVLHVELGARAMWMMMELCCSDLHNFVEGSSPTLDQKLTIMQGDARAIKYLHSNRITHRDIKPGNILVNPRPLVAKLGDFDLCKFFGLDAQTSAMSSMAGT